jgi:hypothetical protein
VGELDHGNRGDSASFPSIKKAALRKELERLKLP